MASTEVLLDRMNGQPLLGIDERPVAQDTRQETALTQPYPSGDAFVFQCGEPLASFATGCLFDPFWDVARLIRPGAEGGARGLRRLLIRCLASSSSTGSAWMVHSKHSPKRIHPASCMAAVQPPRSPGPASAGPLLPSTATLTVSSGRSRVMRSELWRAGHRWRPAV